jgi:hypothetical protein
MRRWRLPLAEAEGAGTVLSASAPVALLPLMIQPSMAVAGYLLALLEAGSASQDGTAVDYPGQLRRAAPAPRPRRPPPHATATATATAT